MPLRPRRLSAPAISPPDTCQASRLVRECCGGLVVSELQ